MSPRSSSIDIHIMAQMQQMRKQLQLAATEEGVMSHEAGAAHA